MGRLRVRRGRRKKNIELSTLLASYLGEVFCKIKRLRGLFAMFRSQSDRKSMHGAAAAASRILRGAHWGYN